MVDVHAPSNRLAWLRVLVVVLVLAAFVIAPFVIWGDELDAIAPKLVRDQSGLWAVVVIGITLLVLDVVLPVPSSVVSISLCLLLGPAVGIWVVFAGMVGAFLLGYFLGTLLPATWLRSWIGPGTWDAFASKRLIGSLLWIAASRPLPVLAEVTSILAGSVRLPLPLTLGAAAVSSLLVALAYGVAAWLGLRETNSVMTILVISAACFPTLSWITFQFIRRFTLLEK